MGGHAGAFGDHRGGLRGDLEGVVPGGIEWVHGGGVSHERRLSDTGGWRWQVHRRDLANNFRLIEVGEG